MTSHKNVRPRLVSSGVEALVKFLEDSVAAKTTYYSNGALEFLSIEIHGYRINRNETTPKQIIDDRIPIPLNGMAIRFVLRRIVHFQKIPLQSDVKKQPVSVAKNINRERYCIIFIAFKKGTKE